MKMYFISAILLSALFVYSNNSNYESQAAPESREPLKVIKVRKKAQLAKVAVQDRPEKEKTFTEEIDYNQLRQEMKDFYGVYKKISGTAYLPKTKVLT